MYRQKLMLAIACLVAAVIGGAASNLVLSPQRAEARAKEDVQKAGKLSVTELCLVDKAGATSGVLMAKDGGAVLRLGDMGKGPRAVLTVDRTGARLQMFDRDGREAVSLPGGTVLPARP
jgi:hypothetical protein